MSTLLEWDARIPEFPVLHAEVLKARQYMNGLDHAAAIPVQPGGLDRDARPGPSGVSNPIAYIVPDVT
jgi:hypothetical protein